MRVAQEEIFGPVTSVITFKDEEDLIKQANQTIYGLSAGIWTRDLVRAHRFAKAIKAGVIWINTFNMFNAASPFGGYKQSGYGREMGKHALDLYTQIGRSFRQTDRLVRQVEIIFSAHRARPTLLFGPRRRPASPA